MKSRAKTIAERFWEKVTISGPDACWEWTGRKDRFGYGSLVSDRHATMAHRLSWEIAYGAIPNGKWILHHCDNPGCVNPTHLFLGTPAENSQDMVRKGRSMKSALTPDDVLEIRRLSGEGCVSYTDLAKRYNLSRSGVGLIIARHTWKHV